MVIKGIAEGSPQSQPAQQKDRFVGSTIALVDDDRNILTSVAMALEAEGFTVRTYSDGAEALRGDGPAAGRSRHPRHQDAAHGRHSSCCTQLRKQSQMPVIFLTSKDDEVDEVLGLRMGADDYIKKPFSQRLLIERIRALLRRGEHGARRDRGRAGASSAASCCSIRPGINAPGRPRASISR